MTIAVADPGFLRRGAPIRIENVFRPYFPVVLLKIKMSTLARDFLLKVGGSHGYMVLFHPGHVRRCISLRRRVLSPGRGTLHLFVG